MTDSSAAAVGGGDARIDEERGHDDVAAALGTIAAAVTLVATAGPVNAGSLLDGGVDAVLVASVALAAVAVAGFLARRHDLLGRRLGAAVAALSCALVLLLATYALNRGVTDAFALPAVGSIPYLLVAVVGSAAGLAAGVAEYEAVPGRGIYRRAVATATFSGLGFVGFVAMQLWVTALVLVVLATASGVASVDDLAGTEQVLISQAGTVLGVGCVAVGYLVATERGWGFVDLRVPTLRDAGYVVGGFVAIVTAAVALSALAQSTGTESAGHSVVEQAEQQPEMLLVLIPAAILVIGPFEELLYRNVIQKSLYGVFSRPGAVAAASVPFTVVHLPTYWGGAIGESLVSLGIVLVLSLLLGAVYERTDNLVVPALVHGLYNALLFLLLYRSLAV